MKQVMLTDVAGDRLVITPRGSADGVVLDVEYAASSDAMRVAFGPNGLAELRRALKKIAKAQAQAQ